MRLLWLPEALRAAGLEVYEVDGWRARGSDSFSPTGLICHATAGARGARPADEIRVLLTGSKTAPAPIAQLYLARDGAFHVVASGRCNHALTGWAGPLEGLGNTSLVGIEAGNDNRGEKWPAVQLDAYQRGVAAICRRMRWTERRVAAHREHQPYPPPPGITSTKSDPSGVDMNAFRRRVAALLTGGDWFDMATQADLEKAVISALGKVQPFGASGPRSRLKAAGWADLSVLGILAYVMEHAVDGRALSHLGELRTEVQAVLKAVTGGSSAEILAEIRAQGDQTRAAVLAEITTAAPGLAAAAAEHLDAELDEQRVGEVLAQEFARIIGAGAGGAT